MSILRIKYKVGIKNFNTEKIKKAIREVIKDSWADFGDEYIEMHVMNSKFVVLAFCGVELIGITAAKKVRFGSGYIYNIEFTAVKKKYQGLKISKKLNQLMFFEIIKDSLFRIKFCFEVLTITSSPRVLGLMARTARCVYPDPYTGGEYDKGLDYKIKKLVEDKSIVPESYKINLNHYIMEGFYDDRIDLMYKENDFPWDKDRVVNDFASKRLEYANGKGREFVVLATYCICDIIKKISKR